MNPAPGLSALLQLLPALFEKRLEACQVAAREMVKRRRDLDQAVKKGLLLALGLQPDGLQGFVGFKELLCVEEADAFGDGGFHKSRARAA